MPYPDAILARNPVFLLPFDETSGQTAQDLSANGYDGTYDGVALNQAPAHEHGRSVEFSSGDAVYLGTLPTVGASWSVSFWMRHPTLNGQYHTVIAKRDSWSSSGTKFGVWVHSSGDRLEIGNGSSILAFANWNPPEDQVWRHIVVVNDTGAGQRRLYVDGVLVQQTTGALSDTGGASAGVSIGKNHYDTTFPDAYVGGLDDVALFNGVLSGADVQAIYDEATTAAPTAETHDLAGAAVGTSASAAALQAEKRLSGAAVGAAIVGSSADLEKSLTGTAAGTSAVSATLQVDKALSGASVGTADVGAALDLEKPLAGGAVGTADASAALHGEKHLSAASVGVSSAAGALQVEKAVTGTAAGTSAAAGTLQVSKSLAGAVSGEAITTSGPLEIVSDQPTENLAASAAGTSSASASLQVGRAVTGAASGTSAASASLYVEKSLSGVVAGQSEVSSTLTTGAVTDLTAAAVGTSSLSGSLVVEKILRAGSAGTSVSAGRAQLEKRLEGAAAGQALSGGFLAITSFEIPLPKDRTVAVQRAYRTVIVSAEDRVYIVPRETRTIRVKRHVEVEFS